ncbi:MAG: hypothetical protein NTX22_16665 [Ignavibacteriales bacterium]|nr:hypothetical protein [Ignavibacteriales bacterium]
MNRTLLIFLIPTIVIAQEFSELKLDSAFLNAKRGVYWCLSNIPNKKNEIENQLIANDILVSSVRLQKEIYGVRIESTGYYNSTEVKITFFKSMDNLLKEGFIKPDSLVSENKSEIDKTTKKKKKK